MAETVNIGGIANRLSKDIFNCFFWKYHPKKDDNFPCINKDHTTDTDKPKLSHPADVVFYYDDPYLGQTIYLNTDLKSYAKDSIGPIKLRSAIKSLSITVECARESEVWRRMYSVPDQNYEVRGLLFVHNHDHGYEKCFNEAIIKANLTSLRIASNVIIHYLGPEDISRLYSTSHDLMYLQFHNELPKENYTFYYPDLMMWRRHGDVWNQPATVEALTAPYFIIKHGRTEKVSSGYLIYYNRSGSSVEEFQYFIDSLSRFQMLEPNELIRVRIVDKNADEHILSNFETAKRKYVKLWGFDEKREKILDEVKINTINSMVDTYNPGNVGWDE
jgi:hypothetical protein